MINLECVATFLAVAKHGGFREASKHTGLSQPTVSQHVRRLEQSLNASLIQRSNAGCALTPKGQLFLPYAQQLMRIHERVDASFIRNELSVGASSNTGIYLLQPYLKAFQDEHPAPIKLVIGSNADMISRLENYEIDVAVLEWWDRRSGFQASLWRTEELVTIVPTNHPWAVRSSIPKEWLKGQALIGGEAGTGTGRLLREHWGEDAGTISVSMQLGSTEAVKHAVQAGMGISLVMASAVKDEVNSGRLALLRIEGLAPSKQLYFVRREDAAMNLLISRFIEFIIHLNEIPEENELQKVLLEGSAR